jgi:predicted component of type VI protein secretion system
MISWNQWLRLFSQPILHVFNHKKLYTNKKKRPSLEGLEERITPVNPSVTSILRNAGTAASTSASYAVSFSESVTGVDSADFTTSTSGGVASTSISVTGSGATYTVTILGITGTGSISLNLVDNDTIRNSTSQSLGGTNLAGISFSAKTDYSTGTSSGPHAITTGLINADGFTDIITANRFNSKISVLLGVGDGTFNPQTSLNTGTEPQGIAAADINGDSKLDLVTANSLYDPNLSGTTGNTVSIFLGNGNNTFITNPKIATQTFPLSVILGDFNSDGKLDIATANEGSHSVSILLGNGNGTFIAATNPETGSGTKSVAMGDVNGDGFLDLATADFFGGLSILIGNGDGSFKTRIPLTAGSNPFSVIIADVNGDGKKDLISANYGSNNVSILRGNGNGTFESATTSSTGTKPVSVAAADLDGDGKIDLAVANRDNNSISLLAGNGDGTFKAATNFTTGTTPYSVTIADFNGDSKPDIATANEGSNNISVFLNTTNNPANFAGQTYTVTAPATQISITTTAAGAPSGLAFTTQPVITIKDASGNTATTSTAAVTMTVSTGATTVGAATVNAVNGIATFTDVGISGTSETAYTLTFASTGLTGTDQTITLADTTAPTITITSDKTALRIGETATLTFTLSEVSTNFSDADITVLNGTLGTLSGSGSSYTAVFTPTASSTTLATFNVAAATFTDGAGNLNTASNTISITVDTLAPTITITSDKTALRIGETATLTFTLSEVSTNFSDADITVVNGTLGTLSGSGSSYTAVFTPTASSTTLATFNVLANTFTDAAGNNNTAATQFTIQVDTTAPTITITSDKTALRIGETATLTFTLSEAASTALSSSSITVVGGALSNFAGSGLTYTAVFTPTATSTATATFNVAAATFTDPAGNNNTAALQFSINIDTTAPTITITSDKTALRIGETATLTFALSEVASTALISSNITVVGGALSNFVGSGLTYTATFTPTNNRTTPASINVLANTFTDGAGNNNTAAPQLSINIDTAAPTITIASDKTALKSGETATLTFTLSEVSTNFSDADIVSVGGTLGTLSGSGTSYTATFTPNTNSTATATINVAASTFTDGAGNLNTASNTISITVDTTAPTITITSSASALKISETATITFTLSEVSTNFSDADITVVNGTLGTLSGSGSSYTAVFTPTASSTTLATFNVAAATFTDAAGNDNTAATQFTILVDTTAPTITIASDKTALRIGETATLTFTLSEVSTNFSDADITVVGGTVGTLSGSGSSYTATFTPTANSTTPATINVPANTFTDAAGNINTAASQLSINIDTTAPTITITSDKTALRIGETATITFTISEVASTALISSNITVVGGALSNFAGSGLTYTATFTPTNNRTTPASINVLANTFTDGAGNPNTAATQFTIQVDTTAPSPTPSPAPAPAPTPTPSPTPTRIMTASSSSSIVGVSSTVNLIDQNTGKQISSVIPFPGFSGELQIAMADMNQDGKTEMIVAAGPGGGPAIMVMDSETGTVLQTFFAFDPAFNGGIFVTIADFNSDGIMDIVVGAGSGGGPHIKIFDGSTLNVLRSFFAYQENFNGGVSVAATDINGDGFAELVTGAGPGGSSHVKVFNGKTFEIISQWYAYSSDFKGGIFVAVGDIGNDGKFEVVTGAGEGGGSVVAIWDPYTGALLNQFLAYDENFGGGARVGISDGNGDGITDILTGAGPGGGPQVNGYSFPALDLLFSFYSGNPNNGGGVFV